MVISKLRSIVGKIIPSTLPTENKQQKLEDLLNQLPKGIREAAEIGAARSGLSENPEYARKASKFYEDKQNSDLMSKLAVLSGNPEEAISILERHSYSVDEAAEVAKKYVGFGRAVKVYEAAIEREDSVRHYEGLAHLYEREGDLANAQKHFRQAILMYEKREQVYQAVELEKKYGTIENVIEIYIRAAESTKYANSKVAYYQQAADAAEESGNLEKAHGLYEKALDVFLGMNSFLDHISLICHTNDLVDLAKKVGNKEKLFLVYRKFNRLEDAVMLAIEEGKTDRALEICPALREDLVVKAAKFADGKGYVELAMQIYEKAGLEKDAAKLAIKLSKPERALEICEQRINTTDENGYFGDADYFDIAMEAAFLLGNTAKGYIIGHKAIERFLALGEFDVAGKFAEKLEESEAAKIYKKLASLQKK